MRRFFILLGILAWTGVSGLCRAQAPGQTTLELDLDLRTQVVSGLKTQGGLYAGSLRSRSNLASGWNIELYGMRKAAYMFTKPGTSNLLLEQATLEKDWGSQRAELGVVRLPFGIYNYQETYASGLIDYPMPRVDYFLNAVDWGVPGAKWTGGTSRLQIEAAAFAGSGAGVWGNQNNVGGAAMRAQTYIGDLILGTSYWNGYLDLPSFYHDEDGTTIKTLRRTGVRENGLDIRFTRPHLLLRGEYLFGVLGDQQMNGWYLDTYYHLPKFEKWTLTARGEELKPGATLALGKQLTLGVRYTATPNWTLVLNWRRNNMATAYPHSWTPASGTMGSLLFQVYYRRRF